MVALIGMGGLSEFFSMARKTPILITICKAGYTASKGAVAAMTKTIALDVAKFGIVANSICPGCKWLCGRLVRLHRTRCANLACTVSQTAMLDAALGGALDSQRAAVQAAIPRGRFGLPSDHARAAVYLASDDVTWVTGVTLPVDGGLTAQ